MLSTGRPEVALLLCRDLYFDIIATVRMFPIHYSVCINCLELGADNENRKDEVQEQSVTTICGTSNIGFVVQS